MGVIVGVLKQVMVWVQFVIDIYEYCLLLVHKVAKPPGLKT